MFNLLKQVKMDKEKFKEKLEALIDLTIETEAFVDTLLESGVDVTESVLYINCIKMQSFYVDELLKNNEDAKDIFYWYMFEYLPSLNGKIPCKETAKAFDSDNNPITYDLDSLVNELIGMI